MLRAVAALLGGGIGLLIAVGFVVTYVQKYRLDAARVQTQHHLRQLALAALDIPQEEQRMQPGEATVVRPGQAIPAATVVHPGVPPPERLSWYVPLLPRLDQKLSGAAEALQQVDPTQGWSAPANQQAARVCLRVALSGVARPPAAGELAPAHIVAIAGIGPDAAAQEWPTQEPPPQAGAWRYDAPTPLDAIRDGLSQTLLLGETSHEVGPWLRGGPATTRGLDLAPHAPPLIASRYAGGQFGGWFPQGAHFAMCDGSVRLITSQVSPQVLQALATISGGPNELPAEAAGVMPP